MRTSFKSSFFVAFVIVLSCYSTTAQLPFSYQDILTTEPFGFPEFPTANLTTKWTNNEPIPMYANFSDGIAIQILLLAEANKTSFACGFYCTGTCTSFLFSIFIVQIQSSQLPEVVWAANRDHPVRRDATLNFNADGEMVLRDSDGITAWTAGKSVASVNLTDTGNLVLFSVNNSVIWQSFDHPTDCLLPGQKLYEGQKLKSSVSLTDWTSQKGMYSFQVTSKGLFGYVESDPPQLYFSIYVSNKTVEGRSYVRFWNGSLFHSSKPSDPVDAFDMIRASSIQYMKLMPDGQLNVFEWQFQIAEWMTVRRLTANVGECYYPLACGRNSICSTNQQCSCPGSIEYFRPVNDRKPNLGCSEVTPLTCNSTQDHEFITLENVSYFTLFTSTADMESVNMETCKHACLNNCSCKAAFFYYDFNVSSGECYLPSEVFTMVNVELDTFLGNTSAFIKVQHPLSISRNPSPLPKKENRVATLVGATTGTSLFVLIVIIGFIMFIAHKKKRNIELEEEYLDQLPGMPTRFFYEELRTATENFNKKLGQGGFGSVFEGSLKDGSKIAVKCLEGLSHIKKSFLAEVQSIGSIHHVNLVRLRGFCTWKSQQFLVYDFMSNGSLDRWIYHGNREQVLEWECRKKIILDIAKGLAYLHEDCRQKIAHLDIKPQNILLDNDFNAKVSDFGLSKLMDRNQSQVMTTMRGTPGYLAPEWLSSVITEKVDVYSFGIVLLEILCGRKNFDRSQPEESWHLLRVFQKCCEQDTLLDIVDTNSEDMQINGTEVVEMMKIASWCLQTDYTRRPSMSSVVKVLEGGTKVESNLDYSFTDPRPQVNDSQEKGSTPLLPSVLSGPR
ncbi:putative protein kinase RLK-Pelle-SD-2b family [Helianthus debilis subsp. tardiflorus]